MLSGRLADSTNGEYKMSLELNDEDNPPENCKSGYNGEGDVVDLVIMEQVHSDNQHWVMSG